MDRNFKSLYKWHTISTRKYQKWYRKGTYTCVCKYPLHEWYSWWSQLLADDLARLSLSKQWLQEKLNLLEKYWLDCNLEYSTKKTKVIFNKQGTLIKKFKFYHQNTEANMVNQHSNLRFAATIWENKSIDNLKSTDWVSGQLPTRNTASRLGLGFGLGLELGLGLGGNFPRGQLS